MKTVVLACNTIREELEKAIRETACQYPFIWVESGLHLVPQSLHARLQEELDRLHDADRVLLAFGFCGHAVAGLESRDFELVVPRADDCITLLLGSKEVRDHCGRDGGVYFLTQGWLKGEANVWKEYQAVRERYGQERTDRIYARMLEHYRFLGLIDTGAYDVAALLPEVKEIAATLKLEARVFQGSNEPLKRLLTGPWDADEFVVIPPNTRIGLSDLGICAVSYSAPNPAAPVS